MYWTSVSRTAATSGPASEPVPPSTAMARKVIDAVEREDARRDEADDAGVEGAGEAGEQGADDERAHLDADHVDAARLGARLAAVQRPHGAPRAQRGDVVGGQHGDADDRPDEPVQGGGVADLEGAERGNGMPPKPSTPPVTGSASWNVSAMSSPKPRVAMAR